jgi:hypothetical protein
LVAAARAESENPVTLVRKNFRLRDQECKPVP